MAQQPEAAPLMSNNSRNTPASQREGDASPDGQEARKIGICLWLRSVREIRKPDETVKVNVQVYLFEDAQASTEYEMRLRVLLNHLTFEGAIQEHKVHEEPKRHKSIYMRHEVLCYVMAFELLLNVDFKYSNFPFDVQDLTLRPCIPKRNIKFVAAAYFWKDDSHSLARTMLLAHSALASEEWELGRPLWYFDEGDESEAWLAGTGAQLNVHVKLMRKGWAHISRTAGRLILISLASFLPLFSPQHTLPEVMSFEVMVLFTQVAYQLYLGNHLPVIARSTVIDRYILHLFCFTFIFMASVTYTAWTHPNQAYILEEWLPIFCINAAVWLVVHVLFAGQVVFAWHKGRQSQLVMDTSSLSDLLEPVCKEPGR